MDSIQCNPAFNAPFLLTCNMKLFAEVSDFEDVSGQYLAGISGPFTIRFLAMLLY